MISFEKNLISEKFAGMIELTDEKRTDDKNKTDGRATDGRRIDKTGDRPPNGREG